MAFLADFERIDGNDAGEHLVGNWKLLLHTTEGSSIADAVDAYRAKNSWPHFTVSFEEGRRVQHVDTAIAARAIRHGLGAVSANRAHVVQVEIVGFAHDTMSDEKAGWLGREVVAPILAAHPEIGLHGPDAGFHGEGEGLVLASVDSPIRFTERQFNDFGGICGHQHAPPDNDHWDPGHIPFDVIVAAVREATSPKRKELPEMLIVQSEDTGAVLLVSGGVSFLLESPAEVASHRATGIPFVVVAHSQFKRYEKARVA